MHTQEGVDGSVDAPEFSGDDAGAETGEPGATVVGDVGADHIEFGQRLQHRGG